MSDHGISGCLIIAVNLDYFGQIVEFVSDCLVAALTSWCPVWSADASSV